MFLSTVRFISYTIRWQKIIPFECVRYPMNKKTDLLELWISPLKAQTHVLGSTNGAKIQTFN
jgi:hypothetical protein